MSVRVPLSRVGGGADRWFWLWLLEKPSLGAQLCLQQELPACTAPVATEPESGPCVPLTPVLWDSLPESAVCAARSSPAFPPKILEAK